MQHVVRRHSKRAFPAWFDSINEDRKAWAWLVGRDFITPDDVQALLFLVLRHRVSLRPEAEMDGVNIDQVLSGLISTVPVPR